MPFNLQHLQAGVLYWRNTNWPQDFHNQFYIDLAGHNEMGLFTGDWWPGILQTLSSWRATWPRSFDFINERALERLNLLQELWVPVNDLPNDIIAIPEDAIQRVNPFINVIHEIKNVNSPPGWLVGALGALADLRKFPRMSTALIVMFVDPQSITITTSCSILPPLKVIQ